MQGNWSSDLPTQAGYYEVWDPRRDINRIVRIYETSAGPLAVRNFCRCKYAFLLRMWELPYFAETHWRGPIHVPDALDAEGQGCLLPGCESAKA